MIIQICRAGEQVRSERENDVKNKKKHNKNMSSYGKCTSVHVKAFSISYGM